ncbi:hypothetical protein B5V89_16110 [Heyndrickxia sporothermodurans]|uniref:MarR family winged helix-turn-helix transcriptional regulator n=1 Tax=Heyndrickxia TaxID=2837504 RepID=UPI000D339EBC|nr:MarR family transcriptional regulator [Heyndrickxia sporothermodurans]MED3655314.1 MarR family transcriptional regulator [Heyndrickxia sporothermodurans]PTY76998.1 hypothetical protein B5V89_16110 [Heyndrickxia sporothermodurans]
MENDKIKLLIKRYEDVYLFATKRISSIMSEQVLDGFSIEQFAILRKLYNRKYIRASELAEELCVNKSAITVKIEKLEAKGFILRQRDKDDRRNIYLSLTEKGQIIYEQGEAKIESFVSKYLEKLDPKDFEAFIDLYEKILSIIQDHKEETNV